MQRPLQEYSSRYDIPLQPLAQGGMGRIWLAWDRNLKREIVVKSLKEEIDSLEAFDRFAREAEMLARLDHPGIAPLHEKYMLEDPPCYTMKRINGRTLAQLLQETRRSAHAGNRARDRARDEDLSRLVDIFEKVCDAVAYAHSRGVLHRDLKPENVMVGEFGEVLVMDWGLAKLLGARGVTDIRRAEPAIIGRHDDRDALRTGDGAVAGTPMYMPPEQARGDVDQLDERSDVYSLGAMLYEILALCAPFDGVDVADLLGRVSSGTFDPPSVRSRAPWAIPRELEAVVGKAMCKPMGERYQSVVDLKRDIEAFTSGHTLAAASYSPWQVVAKWAGRNKVLVAVVTAIGAALLAAAIGVVLVTNAEAREHETLREAELKRLEAEAARSGELAAREQAAAQSALALLNEGKWQDAAAELGGRKREACEIAADEFKDRWLAERSDYDSDQAFFDALGARARTYLRAYEDLIAFAADNPDVITLRAGDWFCRGLLRQCDRDFEGAMRDYNKAIEIDPKYADAYSNRAIVRDDLDGAIDDCTTAIQLDVENATPFVNRAVVLERRGDIDAAILDFSRAIERNAKLAQAWALRGRCRMRKRDYRAAVEDLTVAIELDPNDIYTYLNRGNARLGLNDVAAAVEDFTLAIRCDATVSGAWASRGRGNYSLGKYDRALADCDAAIVIDAQNVDAWCTRGDILMEQGEFERAYIEFTRAIEIDEALARAYKGRAWVRFRQRRTAEALPDLARVIELLPTDAHSFNMRGAAHAAAGNHESAERDFTRATELAPGYWLAWANLGRALGDRGDLDGARRAYDRALETCPDHERESIIAERRSRLGE